MGIPKLGILAINSQNSRKIGNLCPKFPKFGNLGNSQTFGNSQFFYQIPNSQFLKFPIGNFYWELGIWELLGIGNFQKLGILIFPNSLFPIKIPYREFKKFGIGNFVKKLGIPKSFGIPKIPNFWEFWA